MIDINKQYRPVCFECGVSLILTQIKSVLFYLESDIYECPQCGDTYYAPVEESASCYHCEGTGTVISYMTGQPLECWECRGTGKESKR